jgi:hypothetical protein
MTILRVIAKAIGGFFFTTFLVLVIFLLAIAHFTACSTLKSIAVNLLKQQFTATPEQLNATHAALLYQCQTSGNKTIYAQSLELKCSDISATAATDLPELISNATFDKIYFKKYNCSFIQCFQLQGEEKFLFLMSEQANEFFEKAIIYLGLATTLSLFILVAATETWSGRFKAVGTSLVFIGISYFLMPLIEGYAASQLPQQMSAKAGSILSQIFDSISGNLLIIFIAGIILTTVGFVLGYLSKRKETKKK